MFLIVGFYMTSCTSHIVETITKKTACECKEERKELKKEMKAFRDDDAKMKKLDEEIEDLKKDCEEYEDEDYNDCPET